MGTASSRIGHGVLPVRGKALVVVNREDGHQPDTKDAWIGKGYEAQLAKALLLKLGFLRSNIATIANTAKNGKGVLTKEDILAGMSWLIAGAKTRDRIVFYFANFSKSKEIILDPLIRDMLISQLPKGAILHIVQDDGIDQAGSLANQQNSYKLLKLKSKLPAFTAKAKFLSSVRSFISKRNHAKCTTIRISGLPEESKSEDTGKIMYMPCCLTLCLLYAMEAGGAGLTYSMLFDLAKEAADKLRESLLDILDYVAMDAANPSDWFYPVWNQPIAVGELIVQLGANEHKDVAMTVVYRGASYGGVLLLGGGKKFKEKFSVGTTRVVASCNRRIAMKQRVLG